MDTKEKLLKEFACAINAVLGEDAESEDYEVDASDINEIAHKVKFYMDL